VFALSPIAAYAAEYRRGYDAGKEDAPTRGSASYNVTDYSGNKYYVYGDSSRSGTSASGYTYFSITYYYDGTYGANSYTKTLKALGTVSLSGGGSNSFGGTVTRTGGSGSYSPSASYIYNVTYVYVSHSFSCNGASVSFATTA